MELTDYETDPVWIELARRCAMGDIAAMMDLSRWFRGKLSAGFLGFEQACERDIDGSGGETLRKYLEENVEEAFYMGASNMWLIRAKLYGSVEAAELLDRHPMYGRNSFTNGRHQYFDIGMFVPGRTNEMAAEGKELRRLGLLDFKKDGRYNIESMNNQGQYFVTIHVGYEGPDMDGFGMEEYYDYYYFDEFFHCLACIPRRSIRDFYRKSDCFYKECVSKGKEREKERGLYWIEHGVDANAEKYHVSALQKKGILIEKGILTGYFECGEEHITIPGNVTSIDDGVLAGCRSLSSVLIMEGVICIGNRAFRDCVTLKEVKFPKFLKKIGEGAFENCRLKKILLPASVAEIGENAFSRNNHPEIWGEPGTYAEKYAIDHRIPFHNIADDQQD